MSTSTVFGATCAKCGRTGLTSITLIGGLATCGYCIHEMQLQAKTSNPFGIPTDGPGSHAWDLREMQAQRERADRAEKALREVEGLLIAFHQPRGRYAQVLPQARKIIDAVLGGSRWERSE